MLSHPLLPKLKALRLSGMSDSLQRRWDTRRLSGAFRSAHIRPTPKAFGAELHASRADDLYEIIHSRYERASTILTSNRSPAEWPEVFGDSLLASAALDRLTHHARVTVITGESYRQQSRRKQVQPQQDTVSQTH